MHNLQRPMLAATVEDLNKLRFPLLASPKLDGVRAFAFRTGMLSRNWKPIPNLYTQNLFSTVRLDGLDGELIVGDPTDPECYRKTMSAVMSVEGKPQVKYYAFDYHKEGGVFKDRLDKVEKICKLTNGLVIPVPHVVVTSRAGLEILEEQYLAIGYEGVMLRDPTGPYKCGRSTLNEGYLMKLKRFCDSEAEVLEMHELQRNQNEAETSATGHQKRSLKKDGMVGGHTMGHLTVRDLKTGVVFDIGSGFTAEGRDWWWKCFPKGAIIKYKYFPTGGKDKPRFPVFIGFRNSIDL